MVTKSNLLAKRRWSLKESIFAPKLMAIPRVSMTDSVTENGYIGSGGTGTLSFSCLERLRFKSIKDKEEDIFFLKAQRKGIKK